jgi:hypothetical protein
VTPYPTGSIPASRPIGSRESDEPVQEWFLCG